MLETIGYDAAHAASYAPWDAADASVGRVARVDRGVLSVLTEAGAQRATPGGALLCRTAHDPVAAAGIGDWVVLRCWPDRRLTVEHVLPRRTELRAPARTPSDPALSVLAANVDLVALVMPSRPRPEPVRHLVEVARGVGTDLLAVRPSGGGDPAGLPADVPVLDVDGDGAARLRDWLDGHLTLALLGADRRAGAPLVERLVGAEPLTTLRGPELVLLPSGGVVLDLT